MLASVAWLTLVALLSPLTGFLVEILLARNYGATPELDAYRIGQSLFMVGASIMTAQLLPHIVIPGFQELRARWGEREAWGGFLAILAILFAGETVVLCVTAAWPHAIGQLLAPGLSAEARETLPGFLIVQAIAQASLVCCGAIGSVLTTYDIFVLGVLPNLLLNLGVLLLLVLFPQERILPAIGIGLILGAALSLAAHLLAAARLCRRAGSATTGWPAPGFGLLRGLRLFRGVVVPLAASMAAVHAGSLLVHHQLSLQAPGSLALYGYAFRLTALVHLPAASFGNVVFPKLSEVLVREGKTAMTPLLRDALGKTLLATVIPAGLLWPMRQTLAELLFGRGALTAADLDRIAAMFGWVLIGAPTGALVALLQRSFAALRTGRVLVLSSVGSQAVLALALVLLAPSHREEGIALAWSVAAWVQAGVLAVAWFGRGRAGVRP